MTTGEALDQAEMYRLIQQNFNALVESVEEAGFILSHGDRNDLRQFYDTGTAKLKDSVPGEQYVDQLSFATGRLVNAITIAGTEQAALFAGFRDFLRSFCPLDPFC